MSIRSGKQTLLIAAVLVGVLIATIVGVVEMRGIRREVNWMRVSQRPWIEPVGATLQGVELGKRLEASLTLRNVGETPARVYLRPMIVAWTGDDLESHWDEVDRKILEVLKSTAADMSSPVIPAHGSTTYGPTIQGPQIDQDLIDRIGDGSITIYFSGTAYYTDGNGEISGQTDFTYSYDPSSGQFILDEVEMY